MTDRPKHRPVSEAFRRQAHELELAASIEASVQRTAWSLDTKAAADLSRAIDVLEPGDGCTISGDHRPARVDSRP